MPRAVARLLAVALAVSLLGVAAVVVSAGSAGAGVAADKAGLARIAKAHGRCKLTAFVPTEASDLITGTGTIRCPTSRTVHYHIDTQILQQGGEFGSLDNDVHVRAAKTRRVTTGPANCKGLGQVQARTNLRLVKFPHTIASTDSPPVTITCSAHFGHP